MRKTYLRKEPYSSGPEEQRRGRQQLEPGRPLVADGFSRVGLGRSLLKSCGGSNFDIVKLAGRAWSRRKRFTVGAKVTKFATLEAAAIGIKVVLLWLQQLRR